jgi:hypothetical protein
VVESGSAAAGNANRLIGEFFDDGGITKIANLAFGVSGVFGIVRI